MRDQEKVAKPPQLAQTGWCGPGIVWPHHPVRSFKGGFATSTWCRGHPSCCSGGEFRV